MDSPIESNIWKYYVFLICQFIFIAAPIIVLFFQDNGLTLYEIMILEAIFAISIVVLEVPTGYFADIYGRKLSMIMGAFVGTMSMILLGVGTGFAVFLIAEIMGAAAKSLVSGADSAFLYDSLKNMKREKEYKKIKGNALFLLMMSFAVANIIGGYLGSIDLRMAVLASVPFNIVAIVIAYFMKEPKVKKKIFKRGHMHEIIKAGKFAFMKSRIRWLMLLTGIIQCFLIVIFWFYQPLLDYMGIGIVWFGFIYAGMNIVSAISSKLSHNVEKMLGEKRSLIGIMVAMALGLFMMASVDSLLIVFLSFVIVQAVRGFQQPVIDHYLNKMIPSDRRATILSIGQMSGRIMFAVFSPFIGWYADVFTFQQALLLSAGTVTISFAILMFFMYRDKVL
jgi:MFS family permease